jgi:hypothetical protein
MYKIFLLFFTLLILNGITSFAQLTPPKSPKSRPVKILRSPGLESTPTKPTPPPVTNADFLLAVVQVSLKTGSDNKESLSNISIELAVPDSAFGIFAQNNLTNELKSNSYTTIGLGKSTSYTSGYHPNSIPTIYYTKATGIQNIRLSDVEKYGLSLRIIYKPNFFADAWKIENVSITLEFRDVNGNLHPGLGQKTIQFPNAATFLDNFDKRILICTADKYFNALTSFVTRDFSIRW